MSSYAYKDAARTQIIYANECTIQDKNTRFYCQNPECNAHLFIRAINSTLQTHFFAVSNHPHTGWCKKINPIFDATNYDENIFNYEDVIDNILVSKTKTSGSTSPIFPKGDGQTRSLSKTAQIYNMCKSFQPTHTYNSIAIWKMLFDVRSNYLLTKGLFGKHLIECYYFKYDKTTQSIYFKYPLLTTLPNQYLLKAYIPNTDLFYKLNKKLYNKNNRPIVIVGDWKKYSFNAFECIINSGKQIYLP